MCSFLFFFLMIRRPPRSTLFPTRRSSDLEQGRRFRKGGVQIRDEAEGRVYLLEQGLRRFGRSEEHTSELQSRLHLVCRLLLEKKKKQTYPAVTVYDRYL